jgi:homoserine acetyltransferase
MLFSHFNHPFVTEGGATLPGLTIAYHTYGTLNAEKTMLSGSVMPLRPIAMHRTGGRAL